MEKKETLEEFGARFRAEWDKEAKELLAFFSTDPFRKITQEIHQQVDAVLDRHFTQPRSSTIKSLVLVAMVGQVLSEWTKAGNPLDKTFRHLLVVTARESALGFLVQKMAQAEGVNYTNERLAKVMHLARAKLRIVPENEG